MKYLILLLLLTGCGSGADTSSGGSSPRESHAQLTGDLRDAYLMAKDYYNFDTVYIEIGDANGNRAEYYDGRRTIVVSEYYLTVYSTKENACMLAHELMHHFGEDQEFANLAYNECLEIL